MKTTIEPVEERPYHHGNLFSVLLDSAEQELIERGIEGFSLRGVAKRANVSHAAPAHHFGDANGLLTALAARGFERFIQRQRDFRQRAPSDPRAQLEASGVGYVVFALENPAIFRLMFSSDRPTLTIPIFSKLPSLLSRSWSNMSGASPKTRVRPKKTVP